MGVSTANESKQSVSGKKTFKSSSGSRQAGNQWPLTDVASDLTVEVGSSTFSLHKFPLVSRSGRIRKLISESKDQSKITKICIHSMPGGSQAFELAAKFCYGINIEFSLLNIAMLLCASHYLQMTEEISDKNLQTHAESYFKEMILPDIKSSIFVLQKCEYLLPICEEINLVSRIIATVSTNVCRDQLTSELSKLEPNRSQSQNLNEDYWINSLKILGLEFFQKIISSLKSKGLKQETVCKILMNYAHCMLNQHDQNKQKQKQIVETIVGLLPNQSRKSRVPISFLSGLLKSSMSVSANLTCRGDLERRIALQLDQAILEDILIQDTLNSQLYDTDSVTRIFSLFLNLKEEEDEEEEDRSVCYEFGSLRSPKQNKMLKISKLLDSYLAEIALDPNLTASKFIDVVELLPDHARVVSDGLYKAVDVFLKVHPTIKDCEKYRLCKTIDCKKLSEEACSHAAQNERLPVQMAVQVLYFEQIRLRNSINGNYDPFQFPQRSGSGVGSGGMSPRDNYASVRRENRELKLEVARMRMRLTDLEKDHVSMKRELVKVNPANKMLKSFTKKLGKLNSLFSMRDMIKILNPKAVSDAKFIFQKKRHHSIS